MWSACCNSIPLFRKSDEECCPQVLSFFLTVLGHTLQLQQWGSWSIFDGKCLITHHRLPGLCSLWFSSLSSYEMVIGDNILAQWAADQDSELAESTGGWLLWQGYWKDGVTLRKMSMLERRLCREVAGGVATRCKYSISDFHCGFIVANDGTLKKK